MEDGIRTAQKHTDDRRRGPDSRDPRNSTPLSPTKRARQQSVANASESLFLTD
jgi:hypothetical protein